MTDVAFLRQLRTLEAVRILVATLTILRHPKEAHVSCLETPNMTSGASDLSVMLRLRKIRNRMVERIAAAYGLPINDTERAPFVLSVAFDAAFAAKGYMQTTGMRRRCMAR